MRNQVVVVVVVVVQARHVLLHATLRRPTARREQQTVALGKIQKHLQPGIVLL